MKVDIECPGARGGDPPDGLGEQPSKDPFRPQDASLSICRTDCSVTKNGRKIAELRSKESILYPETGCSVTPGNWPPVQRSGCHGTIARLSRKRLRSPIRQSYDESLMGDKDRLRP